MAAAALTGILIAAGLVQPFKSPEETAFYVLGGITFCVAIFVGNANIELWWSTATAYT